MEALLEKRKAIKKGEKPINSDNTTNSKIMNSMIDNINKYSFGYVGTIIAIIYNSVTKRGIFGSIVELVKLLFFFVDKAQYYPKLFLNNIFGFVTKPLERITKKTSK